MPSLKLAPASLAPRERIYAIGDIHGCIRRLESIHRLIRRDIRLRPITSVTLVYLGDYIDRGPDSGGVLDAIISPEQPFPADHRVFLMGNHEALFLEALRGDERAFSDWQRNGGEACLASWDARPEDWRQRIPVQHHKFLTSLSPMYTQGGYLFVHAGIRPGVKLEDQQVDDLVWIRDPFLDSSDRFSHVVVHGHSPERFSPVVRTNRIGIDTGAVYGGPLTCLVLEEGFMGFLQSRRN